MSEIEKRIRNGKVRWVARYFDPDGRRRAKMFDRKVDAQRLSGADRDVEGQRQLCGSGPRQDHDAGLWLTSGWRHKAI